MDKKVIQALFTNICAKDELRSLPDGVHFESERCYATDGKVLVIYGEGKPELDGKTVHQDGTVIEGRYPNVDAVFPSEENYGKKFRTSTSSSCVMRASGRLDRRTPRE